MYYHVVIKRKSKNNFECIFKDLLENDLKISMIKPYKLGKDLYYDGNILSVNDLQKITILSSIDSLKDTLKVVQDKSYAKIQKMNRESSGFYNMSKGRGYNDYEIKDYATDVTEKFLSEAPGSGTLSSNLLNFIKHPMVVRIIGGLLFLLLVIYFGIKVKA